MRWCLPRPSRSPAAVAAVLLATAAAAPSAPARAEGRGAYGELQVGASAFSHSDLDFVSPMASLGAGVFVRPGIGVELFADAPLERGEDGRFAAGIDNAYGVALRRLGGLALHRERRDDNDRARFEEVSALPVERKC